MVTCFLKNNKSVYKSYQKKYGDVEGLKDGKNTLKAKRSKKTKDSDDDEPKNKKRQRAASNVSAKSLEWTPPVPDPNAIKEHKEVKAFARIDMSKFG